MPDRQPAAYHAVRLTGGSATHAALLAPGWHGRALCGARPNQGQLWEFGREVECRACLRRIRSEGMVAAANPFRAAK